MINAQSNFEENMTTSVASAVSDTLCHYIHKHNNDNPQVQYIYVTYT